ncbi:hypothetical protein CCP3SC15_1430004 [Gammaproteobacteria bacterium]
MTFMTVKNGDYKYDVSSGMNADGEESSGVDVSSEPCALASFLHAPILGFRCRSPFALLLPCRLHGRQPAYSATNWTDSTTNWTPVPEETGQMK